MEKQKNNVALITLIIVIVALTAGVFGWMFAKKAEAPITQSTSMQSIRQNKPVVQDKQQAPKPIVNLIKSTKEDSGNKFSHVAVEYQKNSNEAKKIIHEFVDEVKSDAYDVKYEIKYLSPKYLVVSSCADMSPCEENLFDLNRLQKVELQFPSNLGSYEFFEDEKYIVFSGLGRVAKPGMSIEMIDGKKVYCLISEEEVSDENIENDKMTFTEYALVEGEDGVFKDVPTKKEINILDFCKNK